MKTAIKPLLLLSLSLGLQQKAQADLPEGWAEQAQRLITVSSEMKTALDAEAVLLRDYHAKVTSSFALIEANKALRDATFACVREKFNAVASAVVACQADTRTIIDEGTNRTDALLAELRGLKKATDEQIIELITKKHTLINEFTSWKTHFEEDLGEYADQAKDILTRLHDISDSFDVSITERVSFTESIDSLIETMHLDTKKELANTYDLKIDLCTNAPEIQPMPTYTPIVYDPIECPSDAFLAEEIYPTE